MPGLPFLGPEGRLMATETPPPADLEEAGLALWGQVVSDFDLGPDEIGALIEACRTADELADLREAMRGQPMTVLGSTGQPVAHPLLAELRRHRDTLARLLERLNLPAGDEDAGSTPAQKRAQRAAQQRWRDRQAVKKAANG
jgi:hypothetical protein